MATAAEIHIELAVNFAEDPKLRSLLRYGPEVRGLRDLYVLMVCYCKRNLTDGFVPYEEVGLLVYPDTWETGQRDAKRLVEAGLLVEVDGGFVVAAYVKRNRTKAEVLKRTAEKSTGGALGNHRRWHVNGVKKEGCRFCESDRHRSTDRSSESPRSNGDAAAAPNGVVGAPGRGAQNTVHGHIPEMVPLDFESEQPSEQEKQIDRSTDRTTDPSTNRVRSPETETETETKKNPPTPQGGKRRKRRVDPEDYDSDPNFVHFWDVFPIKQGKVDAFKAWQAAMDRGDNPELIIQAAAWFRDDPKRNPEATKWAQGWLNGRRYKEQKPTRRPVTDEFWNN